jgi:hypothetical protein
VDEKIRYNSLNSNVQGTEKSCTYVECIQDLRRRPATAGRYKANVDKGQRKRIDELTIHQNAIAAKDSKRQSKNTAMCW